MKELDQYYSRELRKFLEWERDSFGESGRIKEGERLHYEVDILLERLLEDAGFEGVLAALREVQNNAPFWAYA